MPCEQSFVGNRLAYSKNIAANSKGRGYSLLIMISALGGNLTLGHSLSHMTLGKTKTQKRS